MAVQPQTAHVWGMGACLLLLFSGYCLEQSTRSSFYLNTGAMLSISQRLNPTPPSPSVVMFSLWLSVLLPNRHTPLPATQDSSGERASPIPQLTLGKKKKEEKRTGGNIRFGNQFRDTLSRTGSEPSAKSKKSSQNFVFRPRESSRWCLPLCHMWNRELCLSPWCWCW